MFMTSGGIWKAIQIATNREVVLKVADIDLHSQNKGVVNGIKYKVGENILMEKAILKYITTDSSCPDSIVKYIDSFRRYIQCLLYDMVVFLTTMSLFNFSVHFCCDGQREALLFSDGVWR